MNLTYLTLATILLLACNQEDKSGMFHLTNPSDFDRKEVIDIDISSIGPESSEGISLVDEQGQLVPFEALDQHNDGRTDILLALIELAAGETRAVRLIKSSETPFVKKQTQAAMAVKEGGKWDGREYSEGMFKNISRLRVPDEHTDHSYFIRYEGPGWESDLVGYRFYLDWRNGIDVFGKRTNEMILQEVGHDGFDSYHEMNDWGMDVLKVGNSLGLGAIGRHLDDSLYRFQEVDSVYCKIMRNGLLESVITTTYYNWKTGMDSVTITSRLGIRANSRMTRHQISLSDPIYGFCTGLVRNENGKLIEITHGDYRLLATYGDYSLNNDHLGMAVIVRNDQVDRIFDDPHSHVITFKPSREITYHLLAAWELEPDGITSPDAFDQYLRNELSRLNQPIIVSQK